MFLLKFSSALRVGIWRGFSSAEMILIFCFLFIELCVDVVCLFMFILKYFIFLDQQGELDADRSFGWLPRLLCFL